MVFGGQVDTLVTILEEKYPSNHWIGYWMGCRAGLDMMAKEKIPAPIHYLVHSLTELL